MKKHLLLPIFLFSVFFLSACGGQPAEERPLLEQPSVEVPSHDASLETPPLEDPSSEDISPETPASESGSPEVYSSAAESINALGYDLFAKMSSPNKNTCISPYSIELALGMAANGSSGTTRDEMLNVMHVKDLDAFNRAVTASGKKLESDAMDIRIANSAWYDENMLFSDSFEASYLPLLKDSYNAEAFKKNFSDSSTLSIMNDWISRATNDKITNIVSEIPQDTILILLNAVYFNAHWEVPFPKDGTVDEIFYSPSGDQVVPFMHLKDVYFQYVEYKGIQALRMNYESSDMAMDILIPVDKEQNVTELFNNLTFEEKQELYQKLSDSEENLISMIRLPKFEFSTENISLNDYLIRLGMTKALSSGADFSLISEEAFISQIYHKTFIRVDENGTEAAAVTSAMIERMSLIEGDIISFEADVPFMYYISDTADGTILFIGSMESID